MISRRTRYLLYAFMVSQPLPILMLIIDRGFSVFDLSRGALFAFVALPWGLVTLTCLSAFSEVGFNTGRSWVRWALALTVIYAVQAYALKEVHLAVIIPINFIVFPVLALVLSHFMLRERF